MYQMRGVLQMNEKEMVAHIKALTKVIERQAEYAEQLNSFYSNLNSRVMNLLQRINRLEGYKDE
jgi:hypothetical protein